MRLNAYVLAADPTWIEAGVSSYYDAVGQIVVSYDRHHRGFTGRPVGVPECLDRLRAIDRDGKMRFVPGDFYHEGLAPMDAETAQRNAAIALAESGSDWVLQLDPDEVLPDLPALINMLHWADAKGIPAVEWPMRVLFQRLADGRFLEVCSMDFTQHVEYPGAIAVRAGTRMAHARRTQGPFIRPVLAGGDQSLQVSRPAEEGETRVEIPKLDSAILHNSWARTPKNLRSKLASWGHGGTLRMSLYYLLCWRLAPYRWRWLRDFHPFARGLWPRLRPIEIPFVKA